MSGLSFVRILGDGLLLSLGMGVLIFGSLYYNPRLWLQDYPPAVRAKVPPITPDEKRIQRILLAIFLVLMIGVPYLSARQYRLETGVAEFVPLYIHAFLVAMCYNTFDAVVIDLLALAWLKPDYALLPGTTWADLAIGPRGHLVNFLKGVVLCAVLAAPIAIAAML